MIRTGSAMIPHIKLINVRCSPGKLLDCILLLAVCYVAISVFLMPVGKTVPSPPSSYVKQMQVQLAKLKEQLAKHGIPSPDENLNDMPVIYAITPTHARYVQKADLTRLSQNLMLVPKFHWIVVEDAENRTSLVGNLLAKSGLSYTHLHAPTPRRWQVKPNEKRWSKPRGVAQRNRALKWLRDHEKSLKPGVVYFLDDDNTYNIDIFEEMRSTRKASVWPVGLVARLLYERPKLNATGHVVDWETVSKPRRPFTLDMAGFAINLQLLLDHPEAEFSFTLKNGYQETAILQPVVKMEELEPKANMCTQVYVWHTRTTAPIMDSKWINSQKSKSHVFLEV